jgi:NAD(P)H-quinone oxidoreductase subunit 5
MAQFLLQVCWWIPFYGLLGALLTLPWCTGLIRRTGPRPAAYLNLLATAIAFVHGLIVFRAAWETGGQTLTLHWLQVFDLDLTLTLDISTVNVGAMELLTGLSLLAQFFALGYLEKDWALARFFALMGCFEAAMSGLALSDSLFLSYGLLEILTLSTYLLVGFWYAQPLVITAARDAFLTKRIGDVLLLMGVIAVGTMAGGWEFPTLYDWAETAQLTPVAATLLGLALIAGPIGKCAQFPLHLWLDEAMEGPNPASILRNSVVVACGAFVLIKMQPIIGLSPIALNALIWIGALTAIGASLVAIAQIDFKRALSHSTSAYLGLVFISVGTQWTDFALLLLLTHAIGKALMFMSLGCVISSTNTQDLTEMGGLATRMPASATGFIVGALSIVGLVPLGSFWSLRLGIDDMLSAQKIGLAIVILVVNALTALNFTRVYRLVFLGTPQPKTRRTPEVAWPMAVPMVILIIANLFVPLLMSKVELLPDLDYLNWPIALTLSVSGVLGCLAGGVVNLNRVWTRSLQAPLRFFQDLLAYDFYVDRLYRVTVVWLVSRFSSFSSWFDRYVVDGFVNMVGFASIMSGEFLKYNVSGQSQFYMLTMLVGLGFLGAWMTWILGFWG